MKILTRLADVLLDAVFLVQEDGQIVFVNPASETIFGYRPDEMVGRKVLEFIHPDDRGATIAEMARVRDGQHGLRFENRYLRKDGSVAHIMWTARWSDEDQLRIGVARDITERKRAEARRAALLTLSNVAHEADTLDTMFARFHEVLATVLPVRAFAAVLEQGQRLIYAARTPGEPDLSLDSGHWHCNAMSTPGAKYGELRLDLDLRSKLSQDDKEFLQFAATQAAAAIERRALHADLEYAARYDELTGLPNRRLFQDRLRFAFARGRRGKSGVALLFIDLDDFKVVNDVHGHAMGDLLLRTVARRITNCLREADTVARIGGDEFVALLEDVDNRDHALGVAAKVAKSIAKPMDLNGKRLHISASIGTALYPEDGESIEPLLSRADQAMYEAKAANKRANEKAPGLLA